MNLYFIIVNMIPRFRKNDLTLVKKFKHAFWNAETHPFLQ